ncbi:M15 family metallopeptidase [Leptolyngbya sp. FACHB-16]|uniref:M15 family metallopeptidase n=1 Tax=unclassified Leptolyngbya TaxID=2650499 RepID=UPI0016839EC9|nr:M15 family metallopeptidase [Leptolyngbya sp. FACHB-16]MBD2154574.1 M15 family metallopeptidase [Leptolyngbya sp. FACHB-16]
MKPYQSIPITECGEPLVPILPDRFVIPDKHPYAAVGAPYGERSPYSLRQGVLTRLLQAQEMLQGMKPGWRILIFDAYRPIAVQQYMVDYTFADLLRSQNLTPDTLTEAQQQTFWEQVHQFWAVPSLNPATPPPHSTGAAIDVTLADENGTEIDMGSPIDEMSPRSYPDHFAGVADPNSPEYDAQGAQYHQYRQWLCKVMVEAGFCSHPHEWWHFSYGDQFWVWQQQQAGIDISAALYGAVT